MARIARSKTRRAEAEKFGRHESNGEVSALVLDEEKDDAMTCIAVKLFVGLMFAGMLSPRRGGASLRMDHVSLSPESVCPMRYKAYWRSCTWLPWQSTCEAHAVRPCKRLCVCTHAMCHGLPLPNALAPCSLTC